MQTLWYVPIEASRGYLCITASFLVTQSFSAFSILLCFLVCYLNKSGFHISEIVVSAVAGVPHMLTVSDTIVVRCRLNVFLQELKSLTCLSVWRRHSLCSCQRSRTGGWQKQGTCLELELAVNPRHHLLFYHCPSEGTVYKIIISFSSEMKYVVISKYQQTLLLCVFDCSGKFFWLCDF